MSNKFVVIGMVLLGGVGDAAEAAPASWTASTGVSFSKGDYGELNNTKVLAVPFALTYRRSGLKLRVAIPWVTIKGPASLIQTPDIGGGVGPSGTSGSERGGGGGGGGGGPGPSSGSGSSGNGSGDIGVIDPGSATNTSPRRSGIGDLIVAGVYSQHVLGGLYLEPGLKLKLPTASRAKRIGTGKTDLTASTDLVQELDRVTIYAGGRRKFAGKIAGSAIRSTWGAGSGASVRFDNSFLVGADYDWQQSSVRGRGSLSELTGWVSARILRRGRATLSLTKGLNKNSATYAAATGLSWRF